MLCATDFNFKLVCRHYQGQKANAATITTVFERKVVKITFHRPSHQWHKHRMTGTCIIELPNENIMHDTLLLRYQVANATLIKVIQEITVLAPRCNFHDTNRMLHKSELSRSSWHARQRFVPRASSIMSGAFSS